MGRGGENGGLEQMCGALWGRRHGEDSVIGYNCTKVEYVHRRAVQGGGEGEP